MLPDALVANMLNLAKVIHEDYNEHLREAGTAVKYPTWDSLPDDLKYSNIRQAQNIPVKLEEIGCYIDEYGDGDVVESFTDDEILTMSMKEHELWVDEREANGWTYGYEKDVPNKISPYILPWKDLSDEIRQYDVNTTMNILPLLGKIGLKVCRKHIDGRPAEFSKYYRDMEAPLIISISGHVDSSKKDNPRIEAEIGSLLDSFRGRYSNTPIILMSALAEGPDRLSAKVAISKGIHVAPVLPKPVFDYEQTFGGIGYGSKEESIEDFNGILDDELCYSPCVLCNSKTNINMAYRILAAYLVANSHVLIAAWDGRVYDVKGGTYDCVRMALCGIDPELADAVNPMTSASASAAMSPVRYLDTSEDVPVFWIEVDRDLDEAGFLKRRCMNPERKPGQFSGYIARKDFFNVTKLSIPDKVESAIRNLFSGRDRAIPIHDTHLQAPSDVIIGQNDFDGHISSSLPNRHDVTFRRMDELNTDLKTIGSRIHGYEADGCGLLSETDYTDSGKRAENAEAVREVRNAGIMKDMANRFAGMNDLSAYFRRRSKRTIYLLTLFTALSSLLFYCMILFSGSLIFAMGYMVLDIVALVLIQRHMENREHKKFIEYGALAEFLRTEFYWGMLGINDEVSRNCRGYQRSGVAWATVILKGYNSFFSNDYSASNSVPVRTRIKCAEAAWVEERKRAYEKQASEADREYGILSKLSDRGGRLVAVLSVVAVAVGVFFMEYFDDSVFHLHDIDFGGLVLSEWTAVTGYDLIKLLMIVVTVLVNVLLSLRNTVYRDMDTQVISRRLMFEQAERSLNAEMKTSEHRIISQKLALFHELGVQLIDDGNDRVFQYLNRDFKGPNRLLNLGRKANSGGEPSVAEVDNL